MKEQRYIKVSSIYQRIKQAETEHVCIYIHAPVGVGKTAAVRYYFRERKCLWLTGKIGFLYVMPEVTEVEEDVIVVDDISWITDKTSQEYICNLVKQQEKQVVLIGRSRTPKWLMGEFTSGNLYLADESNLLLNKLQIERMLKAYGCTCTGEEAER